MDNNTYLKNFSNIEKNQYYKNILNSKSTLYTAKIMDCEGFINIILNGTTKIVKYNISPIYEGIVNFKFTFNISLLLDNDYEIKLFNLSEEIKNNLINILSLSKNKKSNNTDNFTDSSVYILNLKTSLIYKDKKLTYILSSVSFTKIFLLLRNTFIDISKNNEEDMSYFVGNINQFKLLLNETMHKKDKSKNMCNDFDNIVCVIKSINYKENCYIIVNALNLSNENNIQIYVFPGNFKKITFSNNSVVEIINLEKKIINKGRMNLAYSMSNKTQIFLIGYIRNNEIFNNKLDEKIKIERIPKIILKSKSIFEDQFMIKKFKVISIIKLDINEFCDINISCQEKSVDKSSKNLIGNLKVYKLMVKIEDGITEIPTTLQFKKISKFTDSSSKKNKKSNKNYSYNQALGYNFSIELIENTNYFHIKDDLIDLRFLIFIIFSFSPFISLFIKYCQSMNNENFIEKLLEFFIDSNENEFFYREKEIEHNNFQKKLKNHHKTNNNMNKDENRIYFDLYSQYYQVKVLEKNINNFDCSFSDYNNFNIEDFYNSILEDCNFLKSKKIFSSLNSKEDLDSIIYCIKKVNTSFNCEILSDLYFEGKFNVLYSNTILNRKEYFERQLKELKELFVNNIKNFMNRENENELIIDFSPTKSEISEINEWICDNNENLIFDTIFNEDFNVADKQNNEEINFDEIIDDLINKDNQKHECKNKFVLNLNLLDKILNDIKLSTIDYYNIKLVSDKKILESCFIDLKMNKFLINNNKYLEKLFVYFIKKSILIQPLLKTTEISLI